MAVANYHDTYGSFPPAYVADDFGRPMHSWRVLLLPFLDQSELYNAYNFAEPWDGPNNRALLLRRPQQYAFPGDASGGATLTNYLAVVGSDTVWPGATTTARSDIRDGESATILLVENKASGIRWTEPRDLEFHNFDQFLTDPPRHGISSKFVPPMVLMADGLTVAFPEKPDATLKAFFTIAGGEPVGRNFEEILDGRLRPRTP